MTEMDKVTEQKRKLENVCEKNGLICKLECKRYPIRLTIRPAKNMDAQMSMLEQADQKGYTSPNAKVILEMIEGEVKHHFTGGDFSIGDTLLSKLKKMFRNIVIDYTQAAHRVISEYKLATLPDVPDKNVGDMTSEEMADAAEQELEDVDDDIGDLEE